MKKRNPNTDKYKKRYYLVKLEKQFLLITNEANKNKNVAHSFI